MKTCPPLQQPFVFKSLFMERVWGGRRLEALWGKALPAGKRIGESWELVDRADAQSVVDHGPLRGRSLHDLWTNFRLEIFGETSPLADRFPLLVKLLDAEEKLSLQVHPPTAVAQNLGGEPKTEMWYVAATRNDSDLYAGLAHGVSRPDFQQALRSGDVTSLVHRILTKPGDAFFIPSGRLHAIGAGNVIVEIQQNSDTTYRVFDWNRFGLDGRPRTLHLEESLQSIDFTDFAPGLAKPEGEAIVDDPLFRVERWNLNSDREAVSTGQFAIVFCLTGGISCATMQFKPGEFFLVPAQMDDRVLRPTEDGTTLLRTTIPA